MSLRPTPRLSDPQGSGFWSPVRGCRQAKAGLPLLHSDTPPCPQARTGVTRKNAELASVFARPGIPHGTVCRLAGGRRARGAGGRTSGFGQTGWGSTAETAGSPLLSRAARRTGEASGRLREIAASLSAANRRPRVFHWAQGKSSHPRVRVVDSRRQRDTLVAREGSRPRKLEPPSTYTRSGLKDFSP
jgi:hypothetical protein